MAGRFKVACVDCGKEVSTNCSKTLRCSPCKTVFKREVAKAWYKANKRKKQEYDKEYAIHNRDKRRAAGKKWRETNPADKAADVIARRACIQQATPKWANRDKMNLIYKKARELNMHVDHIIPIRGKIVSGLHCEDNLQLLSPSDNIQKSNHYQAAPDGQWED